VVARGVDVVVVPGDHSTLLLGENAEAMLRTFRNALNRLESAYSVHGDTRTLRTQTGDVRGAAREPADGEGAKRAV
jgi:hypothetical protein